MILDETDAPAPELEGPKIDPNKPAARIVKKFGGIVAFAEKLGKAPSTCHRWLVSGLIPAKHQGLVLERARKHRIKLKAEEFIPDPEPEPVQDAA
jgi:hypothetical protein